MHAPSVNHPDDGLRRSGPDPIRHTPPPAEAATAVPTRISLPLVPTLAPERTEIGRGKAAIVFREGEMAIKVFIGAPLADKVNSILLGCRNPYIWSGDAIQCAALRREILTILVDEWFGPKLSVAEPYGTGWNAELKGNELKARFVSGRAPTLFHPFSAGRESEYKELRTEILPKLQKHLREAGFIGLVWQAGYGNPVAANNFLLETDRDQTRWTWIDVESGVPPLFSPNPLKTVFYYVRHSWRRGRLLFDDVDTTELQAYVDRHPREAGASHSRLIGLVQELEHAQARWHRMSRTEAGISSEERLGTMSINKADWFRRHSWAWTPYKIVRDLGAGIATVLKEGSTQIVSAVSQFSIKNTAIAIKNTAIAIKNTAKRLVLPLISSEHRLAISRKYIDERISCWEKRKQLTPAESGKLREEASTISKRPNVSDFFLHMSLYPVGKVLSLVVLPTLVVTGQLAPAFLLAIPFCDGMLRTLYTLGRLVTRPSGERPWTALLTGWIPSIGNAAYLFQMAWSGTGSQKLSQFLIFDLFTRMGENFPIWGGRDTLTEYWFNRYPGTWIARRRDG